MLDGRTKETAIQSVAALLHCSEDELGHYFSTVSFDDSSLPPEEALFRHLSKDFDIPKTTTARYFHGCRAIGSGSYKV